MQRDDRRGASLEMFGSHEDAGDGGVHAVVEFEVLEDVIRFFYAGSYANPMRVGAGRHFTKAFQERLANLDAVLLFPTIAIGGNRPLRDSHFAEGCRCVGPRLTLG